MRVLWSSNGPHCPTGYGVQTKHILRGLRDLGHEVACFAWWGVEGGRLTWEGIPLFPRMLDLYGNDAEGFYSRHFHADLLITLVDLWVMGPTLGHIGGTDYCPYFPIDHADPLPEPIAERFPHARKLLVFSRFAEEQVRNYQGKEGQPGPFASKVVYIPHGIDCEALHPVEPALRRKYRKELYGDWPEDAFVVGMVAANKGNPSRKSFHEVVEAFAALVKRHPKARLYLHSHVGADFGGPDLLDLVRRWGLGDLVRFPEPYRMMAALFDDALMLKLYNSFDVLLAPSQGEGFGVPIVEAQACGIPVIVNDHSAMSELVGAGWRLQPRHYILSPIGGRFAEADPAAIEHALEEAIRRPPATVASMQAAARTFAEAFNWPRVLNDYWRPFLESMDAGRTEQGRELRELRAADRARALTK